MEEYKGPQTFNHFIKERPVTTNQTYGFFYKEGNKELRESCKRSRETCEKADHLEKIKIKSSACSRTVPECEPVISKKVHYHIAPELQDNRHECDVTNGTSKFPDNRLTKVKGLQLWHAYTGALLNLKPVS
ncbi:hypothetical protein CSKR_200089 [Clonorchis sinensis]|uniref:Uncharacterized protein n=1 Tax=Clonorchis sinensis TaxID=79923 RepID=A0A8T1LZA4_CLOSI|nr:hypothetical protein CSKR_200089 [Clonorchis sinensis]